MEYNPKSNAVDTLVKQVKEDMARILSAAHDQQNEVNVREAELKSAEDQYQHQVAETNSIISSTAVIGPIISASKNEVQQLEKDLEELKLSEANLIIKFAKCGQLEEISKEWLDLFQLMACSCEAAISSLKFELKSILNLITDLEGSISDYKIRNDNRRQDLETIKNMLASKTERFHELQNIRQMEIEESLMINFESLEKQRAIAFYPTAIADRKKILHTNNADIEHLNSELEKKKLEFDSEKATLTAKRRQENEFHDDSIEKLSNIKAEYVSTSEQAECTRIKLESIQNTLRLRNQRLSDLSEQKNAMTKKNDELNAILSETKSLLSHKENEKALFLQRESYFREECKNENIRLDEMKEHKLILERRIDDAKERSKSEKLRIEAETHDLQSRLVQVEKENEESKQSLLDLENSAGEKRILLQEELDQLKKCLSDNTRQLKLLSDAKLYELDANEIISRNLCGVKDAFNNQKRDYDELEKQYGALSSSEDLLGEKYKTLTELYEQQLGQADEIVSKIVHESITEIENTIKKQYQGQLAQYKDPIAELEKQKQLEELKVLDRSSHLDSLAADICSKQEQCKLYQQTESSLVEDVRKLQQQLEDRRKLIQELQIAKLSDEQRITRIPCEHTHRDISTISAPTMHLRELENCSIGDTESSGSLFQEKIFSSHQTIRRPRTSKAAIVESASIPSIPHQEAHCRNRRTNGTKKSVAICNVVEVPTQPTSIGSKRAVVQADFKTKARMVSSKSEEINNVLKPKTSLPTSQRIKDTLLDWSNDW